ncbi:uncharacterized protein LOC144440679 [Glandiceps talaboti]
MASEDLPPSTRVILWFHARSRSTALEMAIASDENIKVFHEEFYNAYFRGEERQCHEKLIDSRLNPPMQGFRYSDIKAKLEKSFPGKTAVFAKEGAGALVGRDHYKYIPRGYLNTFLVRNPRASILSYYRATKSVESHLIDGETLIELTKQDGSVLPIYQIFKYMTEESKQRPIVIDSEDLANSPRETLQKYCQATGITFKESFLNWKPGNSGHFIEILRDDPEYMAAFHGTSMRSSNFHPSSDQNIDLSELPEELQKWIETFMPLYEEMIRHKL